MSFGSSQPVKVEDFFFIHTEKKKSPPWDQREEKKDRGYSPESSIATLELDDQ